MSHPDQFRRCHLRERKDLTRTVGFVSRVETVATFGGGTGHANTDRQVSTRLKIPATIAGVRACWPRRRRPKCIDTTISATSSGDAATVPTVQAKFARDGVRVTE